MRVAVLAHGLRAGGGRVVGTNILDNLKEFTGTHEFLFVVPDQAEYRQLALEKTSAEVYYYHRKLGHLGRWFFDTLTLPSALRRFLPDVVLGLGNYGARGVDCPQAFLVHNPYLFYGKENLGRRTLIRKIAHFYLKREFRYHISKADLIFCQTKTIENRLRQIWGYSGKTVLTPNVVSNFLDKDPAQTAAPASLRDYEEQFKIFYLTRYYPHKGLEILVEVMERFRDELLDVAAVITIDADQGKNAARLLRYIKSRGLEERIINVGPLRQDQLADYYQACDCLVMPTRLESFSGTYLESMHFGLPIVTSDLDFAHEICGQAALYFDPWDPASIRDAILQVKNNPDLRRDLIQKGAAQRALYFGRSWEEITERMINETSILTGR